MMSSRGASHHIEREAEQLLRGVTERLGGQRVGIEDAQGHRIEEEDRFVGLGGRAERYFNSPLLAVRWSADAFSRARASSLVSVPSSSASSAVKQFAP